MAHLEDRWFDVVDGKKVPTARNGSGLRWRVRYRDPLGDHRNKSFGRKDEADRFLHELASSLSSGSYLDPRRGKVTVEQLAATYIATIYATRKPKTAATYEELWKSLVAPTWARVPLSAVEHASVQHWVNDLVARGLSAARVRGATRILKAVLDTAVRDRRLASNPCQGLVLPQMPMKGEHLYLTHSQVRELGFACGSYRPLIMVLAYCGLRWGEAVGLRAGDVDLERRRIYVRQTLVDIRGAIEVGTPKTHQSRWVPMSDPVLEAIVPVLEGKGSEDLVFTSPEGGPLRVSNWRHSVFDPACRSLGLVGVKPHSLRHTAASLAVASGASVKDVQRMLGHKRATMTLDVYSELFEDGLDDLARRMSEAAAAAAGDALGTQGLGTGKD